MNQNQSGGVQTPLNQTDRRIYDINQNVTNYKDEQYINLNNMNTQKSIDNMPYIFCSKCGNKVIVDSNFCVNCGSRVNR